MSASREQESRRQRTRRLAKASWSVLREDRRLLIFPVVSATLCFAVGALSFAAAAEIVPGDHSRRVVLVGSLLASFPLTYITYFCGVALAGVVAAKAEGKPVEIADGWALARKRAGVILGWTLLTCTVGALLRLLQEYVPLGGKLVVWAVDIAWTLATLLAVPVLAYEGLGPRATFRRSAELFRRRWAEQTVGIVGIGAAGVVAMLPFAALIGAGAAAPGAIGAVLVAVGGAGLLAVAAVQIALDQVFRVFVYRNALGLDAAGSAPFPVADLERPFRPRERWFAKGWWRRWRS